MISDDAPSFIENFIEAMSESLKEASPKAKLSVTQKAWFKFCLTCILMTSSIKWSNFYRTSFGKYKISALSWMLRHSKIPWDKILIASVKTVLKKFGIVEGVLVFDDSDKKRSKKTKRIHLAHKIFDKGTGGYFNGQSIVFMMLVTDIICIPVGFKFYYPKKLAKEEGKDAKTKLEFAAKLLKDFSRNFPHFRVKVILADALYGAKSFAKEVTKIYPKSQFISQLKSNQLVLAGKKLSLKAHCQGIKSLKGSVVIRGVKKMVEYKMTRVRVSIHDKKKRLVIALRYEEEKEYRYIYATRLAWRFEDVIRAYGLRWLIEVFFQDCKAFEGLGELQLLDVEGSERAVTLSLLFDSSLFFQEEQMHLIESNLPVYTVGSLLAKRRIETLVSYFRKTLESEKPLKELDKLKEGIKNIYKLRTSKKHMSGIDLGKMEDDHALAIA